MLVPHPRHPRTTSVLLSDVQKVRSLAWMDSSLNFSPGAGIWELLSLARVVLGQISKRLEFSHLINTINIGLLLVSFDRAA